jgi:hypothetical protein
MCECVFCNLARKVTLRLERNEGCKAVDDELMTSIYPNHMRTFIRLGRAEALHPFKTELREFFLVKHAIDVLHSSNEPNGL